MIDRFLKEILYILKRNYGLKPDDDELDVSLGKILKNLYQIAYLAGYTKGVEQAQKDFKKVKNAQ